MSEEPFNDLTPAQVERLALLAEECAEVIQIVGKILRHGYASTHPDDEDGPNNADMLERELGHVQAATHLMFDAKDIGRDFVAREQELKLKTVKRYLHHQP